MSGSNFHSCKILDGIRNSWIFFFVSQINQDNLTERLYKEVCNRLDFKQTGSRSRPVSWVQIFEQHLSVEYWQPIVSSGSVHVDLNGGSGLGCHTTPRNSVKWLCGDWWKTVKGLQTSELKNKGLPQTDHRFEKWVKIPQTDHRFEKWVKILYYVLWKSWYHSWTCIGIIILIISWSSSPHEQTWRLQWDTNSVRTNWVLCWWIVSRDTNVWVSRITLKIQRTEFFSFENHPKKNSLMYPPVLAFSLSYHRHPYLCIPLASRFSLYDKQNATLTSGKNKIVSSGSLIHWIMVLVQKGQ